MRRQAHLRRPFRGERLETRCMLSANGDYTGSGFVDGDDYLVWSNSYGSTTNLVADGNGDGVINAIDYTIWRDNLNQFTAPPAPLELTATAIGVTEVVLEWNAVPDATTYLIERSDAGGAFAVIAPVVVGETYTDNTVVAGIDYEYRVPSFVVRWGHHVRPRTGGGGTSRASEPDRI